MSPLKKWSAYAGAIAGVVALVTGLWKIDDRYAKASAIEKAVEANKAQLIATKDAIIFEIRNEIIINRTSMIATMERELDDLEYEISTKFENNSVPRHLLQRRIDLLRKITDMRSKT